MCYNVLGRKIEEKINCTFIRYFLVIFDFRIKFTRNQWVGKIIGKRNACICFSIIKNLIYPKVVTILEGCTKNGVFFTAGMAPEKKTPFLVQLEIFSVLL